MRMRLNSLISQQMLKALCITHEGTVAVYHLISQCLSLEICYCIKPFDKTDPSTDTNMTSDQWFYPHKNIIFLVIILILKHVLFRLMQKYLSPVISCFLCCMNWYS